MPKTFTCWRVTDVKLNLDLKISLKVSHAVWEKVGRGLGFHKFSLRNIVLCKWHCQLLRCNTMFFWSPKLLEANKLGEVLTWHLNKRKHISSTFVFIVSGFPLLTFIIFDGFSHSVLPLNTMDIIAKKCPSTWVPEYHSDQGTDPWAAPCSSSQWR